ncbi:VWA domain-containing protein [Chryseobacterium sp. Ch-15]|uniref:VWA domain-containing protein n=1 Tax=Chryseobacterium muglaense TaxID=2893752 RepID=A0A9Q3UT64_9FLAO|nr:vWA domain-containing protein [Chryseobacterium muglaense]MBD3907006.1 VWA domain-containing protein [Chryseobacterium muglaense]MCC9034142.1 VWA domain-containing protein [Chryseobacterium muglaense]MCM2556721.1 VWA domain-containing protein [Chryseobacterium muglaense]
MNTLKVLTVTASVFAFLSAGKISDNRCSSKANEREIVESNISNQPQISVSKDNKIQVALLLDTSNSMDGLIDQAKSRLWNIVNTLTTLKYNGQAPQVEIALYEYGNDGLQDENYIRQVTPLTQDLDLVSEKLFALRTNGGNEYCGAVIRDASANLKWDGNEKSMKLIYIAGNEPFDQGKISYKDVISKAKTKNIYTNTIFCGSREEGIQSHWQSGASLGDGKYFNIDSNQKVIYIETPYDVKISQYNSKLNDTYISYGRRGSQMKNKQTTQDSNAEMQSPSNAVERAVSKSKKNAYKNDHWDLVDKVEKDKSYISSIKEEELPSELKGKSKDEIQKIVAQKSSDRAKVQKEIEVLAKKRQEFIDVETKKRGNSEGDDLGKAIEKSIVELAKKNGYSF